MVRVGSYGCDAATHLPIGTARIGVQPGTTRPAWQRLQIGDRQVGDVRPCPAAGDVGGEEHHEPVHAGEGMISSASRTTGPRSI
jgi:hypothetical protein